MPSSYNEAAAISLVFSQSTAGRLAAIHRVHGTDKCVPLPILLTDGRYMLTGDILTETGPGGLLFEVWESLKSENLLSLFNVIPAAEAAALLPQPFLPL